MKRIITLMLLATLFVVTGCKEEKTTISPKATFKVRNLTHSECKEGVKDDEQEHIRYKTVKEYYLDMDHINTVLNCCPMEIVVTTSLSNDTIYIYEDEIQPMCNCICKYDLNYEVGPLNYQEYVVKVYKWGSEYVEFTIDFDEDTEDVFYFEP